MLLFVLPLFLLLYICPTALTADAAADAAEVAAPWPLLPLSPLPPCVCMPHEMRVEVDGVRWWCDVGMVVVMVGLGICKCEWVEGLGAYQHSHASRCTLPPPPLMQLLLPLLACVYAPISPCLCLFGLTCSQLVVSCPLPLIYIIHPHSTPPTHISSFMSHLFAPLCTQLHSLGLNGLMPIICVGTCYLCSLTYAVHALWPLVYVCPVCACPVCSTSPVKAILVFFKRKSYLPLHLRLKIPIEQMNS